MKFIPTKIPGLVLIEPDVFQDPRGYFLESFQKEKYRQAGVTLEFVQDNRSKSAQNTLRGLHLQCEHPQGKLVQVTVGEVYDVAVDVRRNSPTFRNWVGVQLSESNFRQLYVPPGFAHGFCVLSEYAVFEYKCTDFYYPKDELVIAWDDPELGIDWPVHKPLLSKRDLAAPRLQEVLEKLPK